MNSKDIANYLLEDSGYLFEAKTKEKSAPTERPMTDVEKKYFSDLRANKAAISDLEDQRAKITVKGLAHSTTPEQEAKLADIRSQIKALEASRAEIAKVGLELAAERKKNNVVIKDELDSSEQAAFLDRHAKELEAIKSGELKPKKAAGEREVIPGGQLPTKGASLRIASKGPGYDEELPATKLDQEKTRAVVADTDRGEKGVGERNVKIVRTNIDPDLLVLAAAHQINKDTVALHGRDSRNILGELFPHKRTAVAVINDFVIPYESKKIDVPKNISSTDEEFAAKIWKDLQKTQNTHFKDFFKKYFDGTRISLLKNTEVADEFVERIAQFVTERNSAIVSHNKANKNDQKEYYIPTYTVEIATDLKERAKKLFDDGVEERKDRYERITKEQKEAQAKLIKEMQDSIKDDYMGKPGEKVTFKIAKIVKINIASKEVSDFDESKLTKDTTERNNLIAAQMAILNKLAISNEEPVDETLDEIANYISEADTPEPVQRYNDSEILRLAKKVGEQKGVGSISDGEVKAQKKEPKTVKLSYREMMNQRREQQIKGLDRSIKAIEKNEKVNAVVINVWGITTNGKAFRLKVPWFKGVNKDDYIGNIFSRFPDFEKIMSRGKRQAFSESEYSLNGTPEVTATVYFTKNIVQYNDTVATSSDKKSKLLDAIGNIYQAMNDLDDSEGRRSSDEKRLEKNIKTFSSQLASQSGEDDNTEEKKHSAINSKFASVGKNSDVARNSKQIYTILDQREAGLERLSVATLERAKTEPNLFRALTDLTLDYDSKGVAKDTEEKEEKEIENEYGKLNREIIETVSKDVNFPIPKKGNHVKTNFTAIKSTRFFNNKDDEGKPIEGEGSITFIGLTKEGVYVNGSVNIDSPVLNDLFKDWDKEKYLSLPEEEKKKYIPKTTGKVTTGIFSRVELRNRNGIYPIKTQKLVKSEDGKSWIAEPTKTLNDLMDLRNRTDELSLILKMKY